MSDLFLRELEAIVGPQALVEILDDLVDTMTEFLAEKVNNGGGFSQVEWLLTQCRRSEILEHVERHK